MAASVLDLAVPPKEAWAAAVRAAEGWGAELVGDGEGGTLNLPVVAGLRRGLVSGRLEVWPRIEGSRLSLTVERSDYRLNVASVVVLLISAFGALLIFLWPFNPKLIPVAPFGAVLALGGWFLVLSRLRNAGTDEFLKAIEKESAARPPDIAPDTE